MLVRVAGMWYMIYRILFVPKSRASWNMLMRRKPMRRMGISEHVWAFVDSGTVDHVLSFGQLTAKAALACIPVLPHEALHQGRLPAPSRSTQTHTRVGMMGLLWATAGITGADEPRQGPFYTLHAAKIKLAEVTPNIMLGERFDVKF
eukprot:356249-Chlamydomonas_euryale.AAC.1